MRYEVVTCDRCGASGKAHDKGSPVAVTVNVTSHIREFNGTINRDLCPACLEIQAKAFKELAVQKIAKAVKP